MAGLLPLPVCSEDPFALPKLGAGTPIPNIESISTAKDCVSDDMLAAFAEPPLGAAVLLEGRPCFRLFVELGSLYPTLLKWYMPNDQTKKSFVEVKQIKHVQDKWIQFQKKSIPLSPEQVTLLERLLESANPYYLPCADWFKGPFLTSNSWVCEFPLPDGFIIMVRACPLSVLDSLTYESLTQKVSMERYSRESLLRSFVLMLWMISDVTQPPPQKFSNTEPDKATKSPHNLERVRGQ